MKVSRQPEVNIGMVGHVDHGKTTLTLALTGEWTDRHSEEIKRGISIKLGYADAEFYQCPNCAEPDCWSTKAQCPKCGTAGKFVRPVSFVDVPGHETLMAIMLCGAALMDGALLLVSASDPCPQPQTREHLMALEILKQKRIIIVQNKVDLVTDEAAQKNYDQIKAFVKGTIAEHAPIVPVSAHHTANIDALISEIQRVMPSPTLDQAKPTRMFVARSFDVNLPGARPASLRGGVIGGSIVQGTLKVGEEVEIQPGTKVGKRWEGFRTRVVSLVTGGHPVETVHPGGLVGIGTGLDPALTKADGLVGKIAGAPGTLPPVVESLSLDIQLLERVVGTEEGAKVDAIRTNEPLMLNAAAATTVGVVRSTREHVTDLTLKLPLCIEKGASLAVSRKVGGRWRLIGYAKTL